MHYEFALVPPNAGLMTLSRLRRVLVRPQEDPACGPGRLGRQWSRNSVARNSTWIAYGVAVGSKGDKPRKPKHPLPKVPKGEQPNTLPLPGLVGGATTDPAGNRGDHQHSQD